MATFIDDMKIPRIQIQSNRFGCQPNSPNGCTEFAAVQNWFAHGSPLTINKDVSRIFGGDSTFIRMDKVKQSTPTDDVLRKSQFNFINCC